MLTRPSAAAATPVPRYVPSDAGTRYHKWSWLSAPGQNTRPSLSVTVVSLPRAARRDRRNADDVLVAVAVVLPPLADASQSQPHEPLGVKNSGNVAAVPPGVICWRKPTWRFGTPPYPGSVRYSTSKVTRTLPCSPTTIPPHAQRFAAGQGPRPVDPHDERVPAVDPMLSCTSIPPCPLGIARLAYET